MVHLLNQSLTQEDNDMKRVFDTTYSGLRAKWPNASAIRPVPGGFEGYVFKDPAPRTSQDNRYNQHTFMDKG